MGGTARDMYHEDLFRVEETETETGPDSLKALNAMLNSSLISYPVVQHQSKNRNHLASAWNGRSGQCAGSLF